MIVSEALRKPHLDFPSIGLCHGDNHLGDAVMRNLLDF